MSVEHWNLRLTQKLKERIEPIARRDGLDAPNMARHLLEVALRERIAREHQNQRAQAQPVVGFGGGNHDADH